jgi:hypothetical protein
MAVYRYFLCEYPSAPSPPIEELLSIEADSPANAAARFKENSQLTANPNHLWLNILVWTSPDGKQHGFQSFRLADLQP